MIYDRSVIRWLAFACSLCGCNVVLGLSTYDNGSCVISLDDTLDEDCDGAPDTMDPCPADASAQPLADSDHDGVGDACDPSGATDSIALFDPFTAESPQWASTSGTWSFDEGALANAAHDGDIARAVTAMPATIEVYVEAPTPIDANANIDIYGLDTAGKRFGCLLVVASPGSAMLVMDDPLHNQASLSGRGRVRIVAGTNGTAYECRAHYDGEADVSVTGSPAAALPLATVHIATSGMTARFDSVMVVSGD